jgi:hypothetical protein
MLGLLLRSHLRLIHLEKVLCLCGMLPRHVVKRSGGDVVGFPLTNKTIVLENVLLLGLINVRLRLENLFCFRSVT